MKFAAVSIGMFALLALPACKGGEVVAKTKEFTDKICACKDMDCAQKVTKEMQEWAEQNKDAQGTESQAKEIEAETKRMGECMTKLASGAAAEAAGGDAKE
jgi:hypothetical protein